MAFTITRTNKKKLRVLGIIPYLMGKYKIDSKFMREVVDYRDGSRLMDELHNIFTDAENSWDGD